VERLRPSARASPRAGVGSAGGKVNDHSGAGTPGVVSEISGTRCTPAEHDVVPGDGVAAALLHVPQHPLEALVGKRLDPAAVVAHDVVMVIHGIAQRLEARDAVAEVDPLHESLLRQYLEHAIDAREPDAFSPFHQLAMNLLRADAAVLRVEEVDDARTCHAAPVSRIAKLGEGLLGPVRAHRKMVTVIVTA
jgi:hypothetical protein